MSVKYHRNIQEYTQYDSHPRRACAARVTVLGLCVCVTTFSATARNNAPNKIYQRLHEQSFKNGVFFVQKLWRHLTAKATGAITLRDPELIPSTTQGYKVVQKPNRALNATWNTGIQTNAMQRAISFSDGQYFFPYTFQLLKRGGVQRKNVHVLTRTSYCICV